MSPSVPAWPAIVASQRALEPSPGMPSAKLSLIHAARTRSRDRRSSGSVSFSSPATRSSRPSSNASSAARSSRSARRPSSPSAAARCIAMTAAAAPPRLSALAAVSSSSPARPSSVPTTDAARCHTRRSGWPARTSASAACAACSCETLASWWIAVRTSGWQNRYSSPSISIRPAATAGASTSTVRLPPARMAVPATTSPSREPSLTAATSSAVRVAAGRSPARAANARSRRVVSGSHTGSCTPWPSCRKATGSSTSASGLPAASSSNRSRTAAGRPGARLSSSAAAAGAGSGSMCKPGSAASPRGLVKPSRIVAISRTGSNSSRRATNASTSQVARSSHCASSATTSTGASAAVSASRFSAASAARNGSGTACLGQPERRQQGVALRRGQLTEPGEHRAQQLVQPGKRKLCLGLHAGGRQDQHPEVASALAGLTQQRGLADAGLAAQHQRATTLAHMIEQLTQHPRLALAPDQRRNRPPNIPKVDKSHAHTVTPGVQQSAGRRKDSRLTQANPAPRPYRRAVPSPRSSSSA